MTIDPEVLKVHDPVDSSWRTGLPLIDLVTWEGAHQNWGCPDCGVPMRGIRGEPQIQCAGCAARRVGAGDLEGYVYRSDKERKRIKRARGRQERYQAKRQAAEKARAREVEP